MGYAVLLLYVHATPGALKPLFFCSLYCFGMRDRNVKYKNIVEIQLVLFDLNLTKNPQSRVLYSVELAGQLRRELVKHVLVFLRDSHFRMVFICTRQAAPVLD